MRPIPRSFSPAWALVLAPALLLLNPYPIPGGESAQTTEAEEAPVPKGLLVISAADFEGMPLPGVKFAALLPDAESAQTLTTGERGEIEVPNLRDPEAVTVTLADERYISAAPRLVMNHQATISAWRLYRSEVAVMDRDEREEFARAFQEVVRYSPQGSPLANESVRILASFLTGGDRGSATPALPEQGEAEGSAGAISIRLIDSHGAPQAGSLLQLYSYQPSIKSVSLVDYERTDDQGLAVFSDLELGTYYRAEVIEDRDLTARSTIVRLEGQDPVALPTMILRPRSQILSGVVVDAAGAAAGTLVTARRPSDGLMMTTATDAAGFFIMGPFATREEVTLTFEQSTSHGVRTGVMTLRPGEGELLVPLHVLSEE